MTFEEKTSEFLECIIKKTKERKLYWQPINYFLDNTENDEIICWITKQEDYRFIKEDSYYTENHESLLFAVHYRTIRNEDIYLLHGSVSQYSSPFFVPNFSTNIDKRFEEIWKLAKEQNEYVLNDDGLPEPIYCYYWNLMAED